MGGGGDAVFLVCLSVCPFAPVLALRLPSPRGPVGLCLARSARFIYADAALREAGRRTLMQRAASECLKFRF